MRLLLCAWCALLGVATPHDAASYYAPQTFAQRMFEPAAAAGADPPWASSQRNTEVVAPYYRGPQMFEPAPDVSAQGTLAPSSWKEPASYDNYNRGPEERRAEPWRLPHGISKEQQAAILHHKQSLSSEGAFRFEYASDNGLAAGEVIEPDGSRVGAYQYKDPSGQLVKLKYRAGKEGFQILEGSHLPKSPEPVAPQPQTDNYYTTAYEQQRRQYEMQQHYSRQRAEPQQWQQESQAAPGGGGGSAGGAGRQYFNNNWTPDGRDDGQYRDNDVEAAPRGPHSFGEGYAFAFKG